MIEQWIRPYIRLAEHIYSHSISGEEFLLLAEKFGISDTDGNLVTRYYYYDTIMEIIDDNIRCYSINIVNRIAQPESPTGWTLEQVTIERKSAKPVIQYEYHNERQSLVFRKYISQLAGTVEMEILLVGIRAKKDIDVSLAYGDKVLSYSFKVITNMSLEEVSQFISGL